MTTLLSEHRRRAAHGLHRCCLCLRAIVRGDRYLDQRCAGEGTAWTNRSHLGCSDAYWSWGPDPDDMVDLVDLSDGHLPPCPFAWATAEDGATCQCPPRLPTPQASLFPTLTCTQEEAPDGR